MPRILVTPPGLDDNRGSYWDIFEAAGFEAVFPPVGVSLREPATLIEVLRGVDATIASVEPYNDDVLKATRLRAVARRGVGYDAIDVPAATRHGVVVTITPGTNEVSVAEHTLAMIFGLARDVHNRDRDVRTGNWKLRTLPRLGGKVLGLVGLGRIGKAVAVRAQGMQFTVIAYDPMSDVQFANQHNVRLASFDELLSTADIVSLHLPAMRETANIIDANALGRMKPGAMLINTSRGGLVDEAALADVLREGRLFGAALDVCKDEPLPLDSPLLGLKNILLSPHAAGLDEQSQYDMTRLAAQCLADLYQGRWPKECCVVNPDVRLGWKW